MECQDIAVWGKTILLAQDVKSGGVLSHPDSAVLYNIFAGESSAAMISGRMTVVGTGQFSKQINISKENGFETDENYRVAGFVTVGGIRYPVIPTSFTVFGEDSVSSLSPAVATDGNYIGQSDIEDKFGSENVTIWSDLNNTGSIDGDRIERSINYAEEKVENLFRSTNYLVPFTPVPKVIIDWMTTYAGLWLFSNRPKHLGGDPINEGFDLMERMTEKDINTYLMGQATLNTSLQESSQPEMPVVVM